MKRRFDDDAHARLEAAVARVRTAEAAMRAAVGCGQIVMMASKDRAAKCRDRKRRKVVLIEGEVDHFTLVDGLIRRGAISDQASRNRKLLNAAAFRFLTGQLKKE